MKSRFTFSLLWLPLIGFWSFLFVAGSHYHGNDLEGLIPLLAYLVVSFLFVLQIGLLITDTREGFIVKFGTVYSLLSCLAFSTSFILYHLYRESIAAESPEEYIDFSNTEILILIIAPLFINVIIAESLSLSAILFDKKKKSWIETNKKLELRQSSTSKENRKQRNDSLDNRDVWKKYLKQATIDFIDSTDIQNELNRLKNIVDYSSYFRSGESLDDISELKSSSNESKILFILRDIK